MDRWFVISVVCILVAALVIGILWITDTGISSEPDRTLRYNVSTELLPRNETAKYHVWLQFVGDSYLALTPVEDRLGIDPSSSHFSPPVLSYGSGTGGDAPLLGTTATDGLKALAELGTTDTFISEQKDLGRQNVLLQKSTSTTVDYEVDIEIESPGKDKAAVLELFTMLAPSPDWIAYAGAGLLSPDSEHWRNFFTFPIVLADAGTDAGAVATAADAEQSTRSPIDLLGITIPFIGFVHVVRIQS